jgi:hypothetical protein
MVIQKSVFLFSNSELLLKMEKAGLVHSTISKTVSNSLMTMSVSAVPALNPTNTDEFC